MSTSFRTALAVVEYVLLRTTGLQFRVTDEPGETWLRPALERSAVWPVWPECPDHPNAHPLRPVAKGDQALWVCHHAVQTTGDLVPAAAESGRAVAEIGQLR
ncbi:hypothetical protein ACFVWG_39175 [Kribbella sp. NPDC058245]|uniref:hypothetical protein n=1 Tax=Kribbella sp. NPDC058245 TaxID=3346399 RepID=UPI0036E43C75